MKQFFNAAICVTLRDLVPCAQFKKREKHAWKSVTFKKVAGSRFLNCTNGTKLRKAPHMHMTFDIVFHINSLYSLQISGNITINC